MGFSILYFKGTRIMMFQLSGSYCRFRLHSTRPVKPNSDLRSMVQGKPGVGVSRFWFPIQGISRLPGLGICLPICKVLAPQ